MKIVNCILYCVNVIVVVYKSLTLTSMYFFRNVSMAGTLRAPNSLIVNRLTDVVVCFFLYENYSLTTCEDSYLQAEDTRKDNYP